MGVEVLVERLWNTSATPKEERSDLRADTLLESQLDSMLTIDDVNPSSVQRYTDSLKEIVKQKILNHEAIFRKQVHELHRLYKIQKTLMEEVKWKQLDQCTSWRETAQSTSLPSRKQALAEEKTFFTLSMVNKASRFNQFIHINTTCRPWRSKNHPLCIKHTDAAYNGLIEPSIYHRPGEDVVGSMQMFNQNSSVQHKGTCSRLQERAIDLQLPADMYISRVSTELPESRNFLSSPKVRDEAKNFPTIIHVSEPEEVKLSLNTEESKNKQVDCGRTCYNKETSLGITDVIDLEQSVESASKRTAGAVSSLTFEASTNYSGDKHGVQIPVLSESSFSGKMPKDVSQGLFACCSHADYNECCQMQNSVNVDTGFIECCASRPPVSLVTSKPESSLCNAAHVDFNGIQHKELSCFSDNPSVIHPPTVRSPVFVEAFTNYSHKRSWDVAACWKKLSTDSDDTSVRPQKDNVASSSLTDCRMQTWPRCAVVGGNSQSELGLIDLESLPVDDAELCEDFGYRDVKQCKPSVYLSLGLPNGVSCEDNEVGNSDSSPISNMVGNVFHASLGSVDLTQTADVQTRKVMCKKSEEDTVSSTPFQCDVAESGYCKESFAARKSSCVTNNSSSIEDLKSGKEDRYKLAEGNLSGFEESVTTQLGSQAAETHPGEQDPVEETGYSSGAKLESFELTDLKYQSQNGAEEAFGMEILVERAAESLMLISLESLESSKGCVSKTDSNELENKESELPECSSDSYESIVLRLTESSVDDFDVSSIPMDINETEKKECIFRLKRGRRLKDFQRDVLPGLMSLSRHEIFEDMLVMGEIMKSMESRKNRSGKVDGETWCSPVRGRRSRLNYVGRRYYA